MNKLNPEHLHLLLDEPIYVLESDLREHFENEQPPEQETAPETEQPINLKGENKKGILIITQESLAVEDEEFLFKGLNALDIFAEDAVIIIKPSNDEIPADITHSKRLVFSTHPTDGMLYQLEKKGGVAHLECHSIKQIRNNKELKVSFWLGLKAMFKA